jgi:hypothetical protein
MNLRFNSFKKMTFTLICFSICWARAGAREVVCWDGNCLASGWTLTHRLSGLVTDFKCYRTGCETSGWIVGPGERRPYYTRCKERGCFVDGWYEIDSQEQNVVANVQCNQNDCLKNGWLSSGSQGSLQTRCLDNDCRRFGWSSQIGEGRFRVATCKQNSCFIRGWVESQ